MNWKRGKRLAVLCLASIMTCSEGSPDKHVYRYSSFFKYGQKDHAGKSFPCKN